MILTLKGYNKKTTAALYDGAARAVRFNVSSFPDKKAPAQIEVADGVFAAKIVKEPKAKMTAEERKAARVAKPKLTLAERAANAAKRAEQLAKQAAAESQPSL